MEQRRRSFAERFRHSVNFILTVIGLTLFLVFSGMAFGQIDNREQVEGKPADSIITIPAAVPAVPNQPAKNGEAVAMAARKPAVPAAADHGSRPAKKNGTAKGRQSWGAHAAKADTVRKKR